jgi:hypothetical protein
MNAWGEEEGTLGAHSAIKLKEAIHASTMAGAVGLYKEDELGSLEVDKELHFMSWTKTCLKFCQLTFAIQKYLKQYLMAKKFIINDSGIHRSYWLF